MYNMSKRILLTTDLSNCVWTFSIDLARQLEKVSIEVVLVIIGGGINNQQRKDVRALNNINVFENRQDEMRFGLWGENIEIINDWLLEIETITNPDVIHIHEYILATLQWKAPVVATAHKCLFSWQEKVKKTLSSEFRDVYMERITKGLNSCDCVVAPSFSMLHDLKRHYDFDSKSTVIYNCRSDVNINEILKMDYLISIDSHYDETVNMQALEKLSGYIEWPVVIVSECESKYPENSVLSNYVSGNCQSKINELLSIAKIFIHPVRYDPTGMSIFKAAIAGCTIIAGDIDSIREIWEDSVIYVDPENFDELLFLCKKLISNEVLCDQYSNMSKRQAIKYSIDSMGKEYCSVYSHIITRRIKYQSQFIYADGENRIHDEMNDFDISYFAEQRT